MAIACDRVRDLASGYVLGALDPADMAAVREHLGSCHKSHPEVRELGGVVPYLAVSLRPVEPPRHLRAAVIAAAEADLRTRREATPAATASAGVISLSSARRLRSRKSFVVLTRVAAAIAVVALAGYAAVLRIDLDRAQHNQPTPSGFYVIGPGDRVGALESQDGSEANGLADLHPSYHISVFAHGLVPTQNDEVYVVWLSADQTAPVAVASFRVDGSGEGNVPEIDQVPRASTLHISVTLESRPGSAVPTGPLVLSGAIQL